MAGRFKILGQVGLGLVVGAALYFHGDITIKEKVDLSASVEIEQVFGEEIKSTKTTIPFVKNNEFDYEVLLSWMGRKCGFTHMDCVHFDGHFCSDRSQ